MKIQGGMGKVRALLPRAAGVRAHVEGGLGSVHTADLNRDGDYYVNSAYGKSAGDLDSGHHRRVGEVDLEVSAD